jgi:protein-tyrosine-phosphatase
MERHSPFKILFLCTGNSARSIFGEYIIRKNGKGRFDSYSAGARPLGRVNPYAIQILREIYRIDAEDARSKGYEEFLDDEFDFVITLCDKARESCPVWPGQPILAHWGIPDPALARGTDEELFQEFKRVALLIQRRIELFCMLPFEKIDRMRLQTFVNDIGRQPLQ